MASSLLKECGLSRDNPVFRCAPSVPLETYIMPMLNIPEKSRSAELRQLANLLLFISRLMEIGEKPCDISYSDYAAHIRRATRYIEENYYRELTVENLASHTGVNRSHLYRIFKSTMGVSVQQYILEYRLSRAKALLFTADLSMSEIAASCGFPDQSHFSRAFKSLYGDSPRMYKKKQENITDENPCY
ncbi:MAG: helix-turn-helix transcriptional regulator [Clostridiales bacterium]|jgi:AraC-like DNA-binding protein|nr:helix-turn-helix transcriptional regulator [Clostridiales bacterium]